MDECEQLCFSNIRRVATPITHLQTLVGKGRTVVYGQVLQSLHRWMKLV